MTKEELNQLAVDYAKQMVTRSTGFEVGSGQWRSKVNMNSSSYEEGFKKALELVFTTCQQDKFDEDIIEDLFTKYHNLLD